MSLQGSKVVRRGGATAPATEEPCARIVLARDCGGLGGKPPGLPGSRQGKSESLGLDIDL